MRFMPRLPLIAAVLAGVSLGGCSTNLRDFTGSIGGSSLTGPAGGTIESLGARYDANPGEKRVSLGYAAALRARGQLPQAVAVLQRTSLANVGDMEVAAAYGKALADIGRFDEALGVLAQAHTEDRPNWRVLSTMGAIYDQMGNHERARENYHRALQIAPRHPSLLNNLGLSYILTKELAQAEATLTEAVMQPGADRRVAANLELARSLRAKGRSVSRPEPAKPPPVRVQKVTGTAPAAAPAPRDALFDLETNRPIARAPRLQKSNSQGTIFDLQSNRM